MRLEDLQGRRFGRYEIVAVLGRGGMAAVYRAHDTVLRRDVALKVLYPQYIGDRTLIQRFEYEAVLAASLDHPNIVPIYDVGEADGLVYIAMKLLSGRSLADLLRTRGSLALTEVLPIVEQIASALDYAHARNIVHRDIKAGNILLEETLESRDWRSEESTSDRQSLVSTYRAILTDFGIAKSLGTTGLTGTGVLIGTPDYMAPEQIRSGQTVDYRADIYALGILVFRCLTGRLPFEGSTEQVLLGHLQGNVPDPSMLDPSLPIEVDSAVRRALARDPGKRYQSASGFARALRSAAGLDILTPPPARRREIEGRVAIPRSAADNLASGAAQADEATRRGDAAPPRRPIATPAGMLVPTRSRSRRGGAGLVLLALLLVLLVGGLVFSQALLRRDGGGTLGSAPTVAPTDTHTPAPAPPTQPPAPTEAPIIVSTATSPAASPTGAPTAAPTQVPAPQPTTPAPSATPIPRPTATPKPTATPEPTTTPSPTPSPPPSPTPCPSLLTGGFGKLWSENASVQERVGCPLGAEQGGVGTIAEQPFVHGSMFYFNPLEQIYVLIGADSGRWRLFEKSSLDALPTPTPAAPPPCEGRLKGGFELVWRSYPQIQEALGCALQPEDGPLEGAYQPFMHGRMLYSHEGLGRGKTIYVLYADGSFERYDDTNP